MKKMFLSLLAILGILSVFIGSIEIHAQSTENGAYWLAA